MRTAHTEREWVWMESGFGLPESYSKSKAKARAEELTILELNCTLLKQKPTDSMRLKSKVDLLVIRLKSSKYNLICEWSCRFFVAKWIPAIWISFAVNFASFRRFSTLRGSSSFSKNNNEIVEMIVMLCHCVNIIRYFVGEKCCITIAYRLAKW